MSETTQNGVNASQYFRELIDEFHNNDFGHRMTIFAPPEEYLENIEDPVTLAEVENSLNEGEYEDEYWKFIKDVSVSLDILINRYSKKSITHKKAKTLKISFEDKMDKFMKDHGYCCGHWYIYKAKDLSCSVTTEGECKLEDKEEFYRHENFTFCERHFKEKFDETTGMVQLNFNTTINHTQMARYRFRKEISEPMVTCEKCLKVFHERCVIHMRISKFYCAACRHFKDFRFDAISNKAHLIPTTDCDLYITKFMERNVNENFTDKFIIRMLNCSKSSFKVDYKILENCGGIPDMVNFINCTIFAFFKDSEGNDINFFTLFAQLYGEDAPRPNEKSAYISYIDSVKLYTGNDRTRIYHTIILGLFDYLRIHGYEKVFIWSCPPESGVDYVFPFKPQMQKMPDSHILDGWYLKMFDQGKRLKIISEVQGVGSYAFHNRWEDIRNVPLFSDDLWATKLVEFISQADSEYANLQSTFRASGQGRCDNKKEKIWEMMQESTKAHDQSYFIVTFEDVNEDLIDIEGVERDWIGNRHHLVDFYCESKLMFRDIRQARFASYCLIYRVLMENSICRFCQEKKNLDTYLLCSDCSRNGKYSHQYNLRFTQKESLIIANHRAKMPRLL